MTSKVIAIAQADQRPRNALVSLVLATSLAMALVLTQASVGEAQARPVSFADLAETVSPSVVNITTSTVVAGRTGPQGIVPEGSPFEDFFEDLNRDGEDEPRRSAALGSGFVISADGFIVTNRQNCSKQSWLVPIQILISRY